MDALNFIIIFIALIGAAFLIYKCIKKSTENQQAKNANKAKYNPKYTGQMKHINGLPLPQGVVIDLFYCEDKIVFKKDNQKFLYQKIKSQVLKLLQEKILIQVEQLQVI